MTIAAGGNLGRAAKLHEMLVGAFPALSWRLSSEPLSRLAAETALELGEIDIYLGAGKLSALITGLDYFYLPPLYVQALTDEIADRIFLVFRERDEIVRRIRNFLLPPLLFVGSGIGGVDNLTRAAARTLADCEVCVYDSLIPVGVLELLTADCERLFVGKRNGCHAMSQPRINELLCEQARSGRRVVRLKGGDPAIFGRLAEEISALSRDRLAFRVLPGVSAFNVAAASTGLLPTRRELNRGFTVATPRRAGSHAFTPLSAVEKRNLPTIYYMAATQVSELVALYRADGFAADWPIALVFDAGSWRESVICGCLHDIEGKLDHEALSGRPALVMLGEGAAEAFLFPLAQPLSGKAVLCRGRSLNQAALSEQIENFGGRPCWQTPEEEFPSGADFPVLIFTESGDLARYLAKARDPRGRVICFLRPPRLTSSLVGFRAYPHLLTATDAIEAVERIALFYLNRELTEYLGSGSWMTTPPGL